MAAEIHALLFPRPGFRGPEAAAWASLHGFDHAVVELQPGVIAIEHRPRGVFDPASFQTVLLVPEDGIRAIIGRVIRGYRPASSRLTYLETPRERRRYEQLSEELRHRAIIGDTRVSPRNAVSRVNSDLARWYWAWFEATHEDPTDSDLAIADAIRRGLCQASREHGLDFVGKLGHQT